MTLISGKMKKVSAYEGFEAIQAGHARVVNLNVDLGPERLEEIIPVSSTPFTLFVYGQPVFNHCSARIATSRKFTKPSQFRSAHLLQLLSGTKR